VLTLLFSASFIILSAVYSRSGTAAQVECHDPGFASMIRGLIFSLRRSALAKKTRPSSRRISKPEKGFVLRMLLGARPEHVGARLAPQHVDRRIGRQVRQATSDTTMATMIPFRVPSNTTRQRRRGPRKTPCAGS